MVELRTPTLGVLGALRLLTMGLTLVLGPSSAFAQEGAEELAVRASQVHEERCAAARGEDIGAALEGTQEIATVWRRIDDALRGSEVPQPYLVYWRGLLAECLARPVDAQADLMSFLRGAEFLGAVSSQRQSEFSAMVKDARRRLRRYERLSASTERLGVAPRRAPTAGGPTGSGPLTPERPLLVGGAIAAGFGFALSVGLYQRYYRPGTEQLTYEKARGGTVAGLAVGVSGASVCAIGLLLALAPPLPGEAVSLTLGPVTSFSARF